MFRPLRTVSYGHKPNTGGQLTAVPVTVRHTSLHVQPLQDLLLWRHAGTLLIPRVYLIDFEIAVSFSAESPPKDRSVSRYYFGNDFKPTPTASRMTAFQPPLSPHLPHIVSAPSSFKPCSGFISDITIHHAATLLLPYIKNALMRVPPSVFL